MIPIVLGMLLALAAAGGTLYVTYQRRDLEQEPTESISEWTSESAGDRH